MSLTRLRRSLYASKINREICAFLWNVSKGKRVRVNDREVRWIIPSAVGIARRTRALDMDICRLVLYSRSGTSSRLCHSLQGRCLFTLASQHVNNGSWRDIGNTTALVHFLWTYMGWTVSESLFNRPSSFRLFGVTLHFTVIGACHPNAQGCLLGYLTRRLSTLVWR